MSTPHDYIHQSTLVAMYFLKNGYKPFGYKPTSCGKSYTYYQEIYNESVDIVLNRDNMELYKNTKELVSLYVQLSPECVAYSKVNTALKALTNCIIDKPTLVADGEYEGTLFVKEYKWYNSGRGGYWKCRDTKGLYINISDCKGSRNVKGGQFHNVKGKIKFVVDEEATVAFLHGRGLSVSEEISREDVDDVVYFKEPTQEEIDQFLIRTII